MPLIIDANRACDFEEKLNPVAEEIVRRIRDRTLKITVGGILLRELTKTKMRKLLVEWARVGAVVSVSNSDVDKLTIQVARLSIKSDDPHVIALALVSGARLLYSEDQSLCADFKNVRLLTPKGKIIRSNTKPKIARNLMEELGT